ncbi:Photosystem I reaction center subunit VI-1, chloroplastic [Sesamum alatum]|uniref:Photosystem I reaction center subunit VI n=1 Tax=Sesamum alatum TaxID=300844 RepID=A0AAE1YIU5_9LAMI|nr:Photosystem I reaction center subunit VI-1, chloroplastic [Sesamum alatum]
MPTNYKATGLVAKYGDKSVYFDRQHDGPMGLAWIRCAFTIQSFQSMFFETFAAPFTKRDLLLKFLILGGGSTLAYVSSQATRDVLPIVNGPQLPPKPKLRGKI